MAVNLQAPGELLPVAGVSLAAGSAGIKKNGKNDLVLIRIRENSTCSAVFTRNRFRAAPVLLAEQHIKQTTPQLLMINSGNANAGTGQSGLDNALKTCQFAATLTSLNVQSVLPFSTGVIGQDLPTEKFENSLPKIVAELNEENWSDAATGIMTTDTVAKAVSRQCELNGQTITITGIAKGSGMIKPDMATMLSFVATDARLSQELLDKTLKTVVDHSFNCITVDGDTSTNDSCVLIATGQSDKEELLEASEAYSVFYKELESVMQQLAQAIIRDGEGATKFIEIHVKNAASEQDARTVAYTVAHSPLVKTALFASDPNWGRILAAVGRAEIPALDVDTIEIYLDDVCIVRNGGRASEYTEEAGQQVMSSDEICITINIYGGDQGARVWTSDLSYDYVKINAEYRS